MGNLRKTKEHQELSWRTVRMNKKKSVEITEEELKELYNKETGKNAIYRKKITKLYTEWRKNKKEELGVK